MLSDKEMLRIAESRFYGLNNFLGGRLIVLCFSNHGNPEEDGEFRLHIVLIAIGHNISNQDQSNCQNFVFLLQCNFTFSMNI